MKHIVLAFLLLSSFTSNAQYKISGIAIISYEKTNLFIGASPVKKAPAMGASVYIVSLDTLRDSSVYYIKRYKDADDIYSGARGKVLKGQDRIKVHQTARGYLTEASNALDVVESSPAVAMVDGTGEYAVNNLKPGRYFVILKADVTIKAPLGKRAKAESALAETAIKEVDISNADQVFNHVFHISDEYVL